jgi:hypothetical protein
MDWTDQDTAYFASLVNDIEDDDTRLKKKIKEKIISNKYILKALDNKELEEAEAEPDEYFGRSILPYYIVHPTQVQANNFICFETRFDRLGTSIDRYNKTQKRQQIVFYILCEQKNQDVTTDTELSGGITDLGIARHDLIASLLIHEFNFYNFGGGQAQLISNVPSTTDDNYACRTLTFEFNTDANLVKTVNGEPQFVNKLYGK